MLVKSMSGLRVAALYGFRPHMLGLCGPKEALEQRLLLKFLQGKLSHRQILPVIKKFKGAYPYYCLIAKKNKIRTGPFNKKVVEAYWIGNKLLDKVTTDDLKKMVKENFSGPGLLNKNKAAKKAGKISAGSKPHHSFHVLVIGSVTGSVDFRNTKLKDLCRVGWGKVIKKFKVPRPRPIRQPADEGGQNSKFKVLVEYQPLVGEKKIKLGKPIKKEIIWDKEITPSLKIGDFVSFHWNWLVQILNQEDVINLKKYTLNTLNCLK